MTKKQALAAMIAVFLLVIPGLANAAEDDLNARVNALEKSLAQMSDAVSRAGGDKGIPLHGFADVDYGRASKNYGEDRPDGFGIGSLDLYLSPQFGDHVRALVELVVERDADGQIGVDLERVQAGYAFGDALTMWAGRYHTPYGYWNTAFHHGAQIQTSILRPKFIDFEDKGGILPSHTVGLWATGKIGVGSGKFVYNL